MNTTKTVAAPALATAFPDAEMLAPSTFSGAHFSITTFDLDRAAEHGNTRATVKVQGFWSSEQITVFLDRRVTGASSKEATWEVSISHSSGGRGGATGEAVLSDIEAEINFGSALIAISGYARSFLSSDEVAMLEAEYLRRLADRQAAHDAEVAAKQARFDADRPLGERGAKALLDLAATTTRHSGKATALSVFARGFDDPSVAIVTLSRGGVIQLHWSLASMSRATFLARLALASSRSCIDTSDAATAAN